jgi:general L-amino acid transport system permease protein
VTITAPPEAPPPVLHTTEAPDPAEVPQRTASYRMLARFTDLCLDVVAVAAAVALMALAEVVSRLFGWTGVADDLSGARTSVGVVAGVAFHLYNNVVVVARTGTSLAKRELGLAIVPTAVPAPVADSIDQRPGIVVAAVREVVAVALAPLHLLALLVDPQRRGLGDRAASTTVVSRDAIAAPGLWRDVRALKIIGQIVAVVAVAATLRWLFGNLIANLDRVGIPISFDFLDLPTNFQVPFDPGFDPRSPVRNMIWVGVKNTLAAASVGITIAVVLGTLIGIARLSTNWLVSKLAMIYVEVFRNIPPLLIIIFFGSAVFTNGPFPLLSPTSEPTQLSVPGSDSTWLILSNTVWGIPSFASNGNTGAFWIAVLVALVVAIGLWRWRTKVNIDTGQPHHRVLWSVGAFAAITAAAFLALGAPYVWSFPAVAESGRRIEGGFVLNFGYISVTVALGLYTASHIAEIIRGSILAVDKGQSEAANALALSGFQRYRFVVLPQAMRIAIPPVINQFLNLTKNTSLGTAVAYAEITALTQSSIGNGRPAVPSLLVLIGIYLTFSFTISIVLNQVNKRFQVVGR